MPMWARALIMELLLIAYIIVCFFTVKSWYKDDVSELGETIAKAKRRLYIAIWSGVLAMPLGIFIFDFQLSLTNMVICMSVWYTGIFAMLMTNLIIKGVIKSKTFLLTLCLLVALVFVIFTAILLL